MTFVGVEVSDVINAAVLLIDLIFFLSLFLFLLQPLLIFLWVLNDFFLLDLLSVLLFFQDSFPLLFEFFFYFLKFELHFFVFGVLYLLAPQLAFLNELLPLLSSSFQNLHSPPQGLFFVLCLFLLLFLLKLPLPFFNLPLDILFTLVRAFPSSIYLQFNVSPLLNFILNVLHNNGRLFLGVFLLDFLEYLVPLLAFLPIAVEQETFVPAFERVNVFFLEHVGYGILFFTILALLCQF